MPRLINFLLFGIFFLTLACGQTKKIEQFIPKEPLGWVSDFENVFTPTQIQTLDSIILDHGLEKGNQIAIVTLDLDSNSIHSLGEFKELSLLLFNQWGIGQKNLDNGVGIIFSRKLKMIRIEVGKGLTLKLTEQEARSIIDNVIIPDFRKSDYYQGILNGLQEAINEIK